MKSPTTKLQKKCDSYLTPIIKLLHPKCLLCGKPTEVAHHHIHKSKSAILRYNFDNLINLCHHCHFVLHQNESYWASKIVQIKGLKWFAKLEKKKDTFDPNFKVNIGYYKEVQERLEKELKKLSTSQ